MENKEKVSKNVKIIIERTEEGNRIEVEGHLNDLVATLNYVFVKEPKFFAILKEAVRIYSENMKEIQNMYHEN